MIVLFERPLHPLTGFRRKCFFWHEIYLFGSLGAFVHYTPEKKQMFPTS
jgi:hypothetical protein